MKLLYRCCAGLDVHRDTVSPCIRRRVAGNSDIVLEEEVFGTFTLAPFVWIGDGSAQCGI
jgi:hypothetical protein